MILKVCFEERFQGCPGPWDEGRASRLDTFNAVLGTAFKTLERALSHCGDPCLNWDRAFKAAKRVAKLFI